MRGHYREASSNLKDRQMQWNKIVHTQFNRAMYSYLKIVLTFIYKKITKKKAKRYKLLLWFSTKGIRKCSQQKEKYNLTVNEVNTFNLRADEEHTWNVGHLILLSNIENIWTEYVINEIVLKRIRGLWVHHIYCSRSNSRAFSGSLTVSDTFQHYLNSKLFLVLDDRKLSVLPFYLWLVGVGICTLRNGACA